MKKEEILEKSRNENNDERNTRINFNSNYYALLLGDIVFTILWIYDEIKAMQNDTTSTLGNLVMPLLFAQLLGEVGYKYLNNGRKKSDLFWTIAVLILEILSLVYYFMYAI